MGKECNSVESSILESTLHYQLPQWKNNTITSWLVQMNYAMRRVDDIMWELALRTGIDGLPDETVEEVVRLSNWSEQANEHLETLTENIGNMLIAQENMDKSITAILARLNTLTTNTTNLDTRMQTIESRMDNLQMTMEKLETNLNTLTERVTALENKEGG